MNWLLGSITVLFALSTIAERDNEKRGIYALCFLVCMAVLTLINIF